MYQDIDSNSIDIIGERKDGGIELYIIVDDISTLAISLKDGSSSEFKKINIPNQCNFN